LRRVSFGTSGIRGPYPDVVDPKLAFRLGLALAKLAGGRGYVNVGRDTRKTSALLALSLSSGAMAGGANVRDVGLVPTPVLAYSVKELKAKYGAMVTASHNPPSDNGVKLFDWRGMELTRREEEKVEEELAKPEELASWSEVGSYEEYGAVGARYVDDLLEFLEAKRRASVTVLVDCANGVSSQYTPAALRELGARVVTVNCNFDPLFSGRHPEPRQDVLECYRPVLADLGARALFAHDGDADRLSVLTPRRGFVRQDYVIALFARWKLSERRGDVVVSVDVGNSVKEVVEELGGRIVRAKLGKVHEKLEETPSAVLAAEPWKLIDPSWGPWPDGIYQAAALAAKMLEEGGDLDKLLDEIPSYYWSRGSVPVGEELKLAVFEEAKKALLSKLGGRASSTLEVDGLRLDFDDGSWLLVRPSGTESKIRFYAEASTKERLDELVREAVSSVAEAARKLGAKLGDPVVNSGR